MIKSVYGITRQMYESGHCWFNKMIEFLCEKWMIFILMGKKTKDFIFLKKIVCTINNSDEIKSQINIQWIGSESKPDKRKISEKNEKLCKTTVNYTLNIQAIIQIQWNCVRIFFFLQKCEYSKEIKIIRLFIRRNVLCRMKKKWIKCQRYHLHRTPFSNQF